MTAKVAGGVASFDDVENDTAGTLSLQFAAPSLPPVTSAPSTVMPAPATHLVVTQPPTAVTAGAPFGLTLDAKDNFGNVDTSFGGPVTVALASGSSGSLSGTTTMTASGGVAAFADLVDSASGPISSSATSGTLTGTSTGTVPVSPAPAAKLVIQVQPSQSATAGSAFATQPVIYEEDQFGNLLTGDNSTSVTVYLGSGERTATGHAERDRDRWRGQVHRPRRPGRRNDLASVHGGRPDVDPERPDRRSARRSQASWSSTHSRQRPQRRGNRSQPSPSSGKKISTATS